jgi:hypothetical protein
MESTLHGYPLHVDRTNAPAEAEKTEALRGASTPRAKVIESANKSKSKPLRNAVTRVYIPARSAKPSRTSAAVEIHASAGIIADGTNQISFAVYASKCEKSPQETRACPAGPQKPNRSPTAERNETPRASRRNNKPSLAVHFIEPDPPPRRSHINDPR